MDTINDNIVFIIAHKYIKGYTSFLKYYVDNIQKFYPNALTIVVDNNSNNFEEIFDSLKGYKNLIFLNNDIDCKFEIGAYQIALDYLKNSKKFKKYSYFVCTQDTFILKNRYDFNELQQKNIKAASIIGWPNDFAKMDVMQPTLEKLGLFNGLHFTNLCWCNSFIVSADKSEQLNSYFKQIIIKVRHQSEASERYLGRLLFELNGDNFAIDGNDNTYNVNGVNYNCLTVNPLDNIDKYFCKTAQQKNERTNEK